MSIQSNGAFGRRVSSEKLIVTFLFLAAVSASAQTVTATVSAGTNPDAVAVNPVTNKIYVANSGSSNVTVIDGASNSVSTVTTGSGPLAVAVNPVTNKIYVATNSNVTVIDGATNTTTTVSAGSTPYALAVNPVTNKIYVANLDSNNVTVIDGATNSTTTVTDPNANAPYAVAVNPVTNRIYVANKSSNNVTAIDGATNNVTTVTDSSASGPVAVGVNPVTNKIYVANNDSNNVTVIDGATNNTITFSEPSASDVAFAVDVNPVTNKIYVANTGTNGNLGDVTVIDGATNGTTDVIDPNASYPYAVAVNPATNQIYVANGGSNNITVIDGSTNNTTTVTDPNANEPVEVAVNPVTNKIYVVNNGSNNVTVIDGATNDTATVTTGTRPYAVAVNPVTNRVYVANSDSNNVTVIDGATNSTTTLTDPNARGPGGLAVNQVTNKIYVANSGSNNVTVIDGATNTITTVTDPNASFPLVVAVNPATNKIYVANNGSNNVTVIDGSTNTTTTLTDSHANSPDAVAVNPVTNKIYVINGGNYTVTVIDGATNTLTTVSDPNEVVPDAVAVNPVTNQIYVANYGNGGLDGYGTVTVIYESNVQAIPLQASIAPQTNNEVTGASATFKFSASSSFSPTAPPPDGLYYQVDTWQGPWQPATSLGSNNFNGPVSGLAPGMHILYAYATDGQDATSVNTGQQSSPLISNITAYVFLEQPPIGTPSVVSASPNAPSGAAQTFILTYSDTGGTDALQFVSADFNSSLTAAYGCSVRYEQAYYNPAKSALYLYNDAGTAVMGPLVLGSSGTLANSQCTINGTGSSVSTDGDTLTLTLSVTANSSFEGPKNIYMYAADNSSAITGWMKEGTWMPSASFVPSVVSVSPNPAVGPQNFVLTYSDTGGSGALISVAALFNTSLSSKKACYVYYAPQSNLLYLQNDNGQGAMSITPGSGTLANSQCTINGNSSSVVTSGNNLTLNLAVTGSSNFEGLKNIYMYAADSSSASTGWAKEGTWTPSPAFTPSVVAASPNPASGASQYFVLTYSDTGSYAALTSVAVLFNSSLSSKKACYVYYVPQTNLLYLQNDNGQGATSITPGSSGTLSNSQCTINASPTSVVTSGNNNLTLNLAVMGSSSFTGTQKIYMKAADDSNASSGWVDEGAWTP